MAKAAVEKVTAREVLDSRGNPTVEATAHLSDGASAWAMVPSGASTGRYEALELRDGDGSRYGGKGVLKAVANVEQVISPALKGVAAGVQEAVDRILVELDGTPNKAKLGANATLAVSMAAAKAASASQGKPLHVYMSGGGPAGLPVPMFNILNGGRHAHNSIDIQEVMVVPAGLPSFAEALRCGAEVYHTLGRLLRERGLGSNVGDEGGYAATLSANLDALALICAAIEDSGYRPGDECFIALDAAASEFYDDGNYTLACEGRTLSSDELIDLYRSWVQEYPIISIEDGLHEDDWAGWRELNRVLGARVQLVGDDLYTTNPRRIQTGVQEAASNAVLIKPNQIGTLTETLEAVSMTKAAGWGSVMSHRSGETEDTTIADLAVGWNTGQIKTGAPCRSERLAKYNRLLKIEDELGDEASYAGMAAFPHICSRMKGASL
ncbi:MAG: phosphopyruvate hydratase [Dehalococcoidia bacterium]|nr:phosphopyruvate hydratase [Dehalococcoidia bacterium]